MVSCSSSVYSVSSLTVVVPFLMLLFDLFAIIREREYLRARPVHCTADDRDHSLPVDLGGCHGPGLGVRYRFGLFLATLLLLVAGPSDNVGTVRAVYDTVQYATGKSEPEVAPVQGKRRLVDNVGWYF